MHVIQLVMSKTIIYIYIYMYFKSFKYHFIHYHLRIQFLISKYLLSWKQVIFLMATTDSFYKSRHTRDVLRRLVPLDEK